jgi:hypothetical protein
MEGGYRFHLVTEITQTGNRGRVTGGIERADGLNLGNVSLELLTFFTTYPTFAPDCATPKAMNTNEWMVLPLHSLRF